MQDGNLDALKEVLNCGELLDLDEPSNGPIPYTALFLAYINDHFQVSWVCVCIILYINTVKFFVTEHLVQYGP